MPRDEALPASDCSRIHFCLVAEPYFQSNPLTLPSPSRERRDKSNLPPPAGEVPGGSKGVSSSGFAGGEPNEFGSIRARLNAAYSQDWFSVGLAAVPSALAVWVL